MGNAHETRLGCAHRIGAEVATGIVIRAANRPLLADMFQLILPLGTLWLNALRMTLVPLVFAMVAQGMITLDRSGGAGGRLLGITLPLIQGLPFLAAAIGIGLSVASNAVWLVTRGALGGIAATHISAHTFRIYG
ncbi:cation:dicarboxylase symporter family transporter [Sphingomonas sp. CGMCC 1.13654]|uniref:Cation:dicarboxylase symporter family transporter n=1 Tax=Sphingomonas chungangi TaxID=2683589 RepID=A0A838L4W2_9SPHN|nr:cation:dicarboxylase symporter family transporter [Sphingomonas chungangi]MBA2933940.1 cation:dicarboxylase symporter family transporter [Sphingomonas chungangi]MVW57068.1 cation:dicarboxylase symporter family transporter [Sphingomonas chungangi]